MSKILYQVGEDLKSGELAEVSTMDNKLYRYVATYKPAKEKKVKKEFKKK